MDKIMNTPTHIRLFGTASDSIVDGPDLRFAVFVQGCSHHCPGCHNPESQPFEGGTLEEIDKLVSKVQENGLIRGVTLSGGEPFDQVEATAELALRLKSCGYNIWTYTGYLYEDLIARSSGREDESAAAAIAKLLANTDVLVDGPFVQAKKSLGLKYRGSSNQRLIDMEATRAAGKPVLWSSYEDFPVKPASW